MLIFQLSTIFVQIFQQKEHKACHTTFISDEDVEKCVFYRIFVVK